jgi:hypothetical protein
MIDNRMTVFPSLWVLGLLLAAWMLGGCGPEPFRLRVETTPEADVVVRQNGRLVRRERGMGGDVFRLDFEGVSSRSPYIVEATPFGTAASRFDVTTRSVDRGDYLRLPFRSNSDENRNMRLLEFPLQEHSPENLLQVTLVFENVRRVFDSVESAPRSGAIPSYDEWAEIRRGVEQVLMDLVTEKERQETGNRFAVSPYGESASRLRDDVQRIINEMTTAQGTQTGDDVRLPGTATATRLYRYEIQAELSSIQRANEIAEAIARFGALRQTAVGGQRVEFRPTDLRLTYSTDFIEAGVTTEVVGFAESKAEVYILPDPSGDREVLVKEVGPTTWRQRYRLSPGQQWIYGYVAPRRDDGTGMRRYFRINIFTQRQENITEAMFRARPQS